MGVYEFSAFRCVVNYCRAHHYVALKVYVHTSSVHREIPFYHHIARRIAGSSHQGRGNIRRLLDSFEVNGPHGKHIILVFEAAQMSLRDMKVVFRRDGFDEDFVRGAIIELLQALYFLHSQGEVVHTGIVPSPPPKKFSRLNALFINI